MKLIAPPQVNSVKLCGEALEHGAGTAISDVLQETSTADGVIFLQAGVHMQDSQHAVTHTLSMSCT